MGHILSLVVLSSAMGNGTSHPDPVISHPVKRLGAADIEKAAQRNLPIHIRSSEKQWPERTWPRNIGSPPDFDVLSDLIKRLTQVPLSKTALKRDDGPTPTAEEVVKTLKKKMRTNILATVRVGG